jgi:hypothetical protein
MEKEKQPEKVKEKEKENTVDKAAAENHGNQKPLIPSTSAVKVENNSNSSDINNTDISSSEKMIVCDDVIISSKIVTDEIRSPNSPVNENSENVQEISTDQGNLTKMKEEDGNRNHNRMNNRRSENNCKDDNDETGEDANMAVDDSGNVTEMDNNTEMENDTEMDGDSKENESGSKPPKRRKKMTDSQALELSGK